MEGAEVIVSLPLEPRRPRGLFIQQAEPLPDTVVQGTDRLGLGVKQTPFPCSDSYAGPLECDSEGEILIPGQSAAGDKADALGTFGEEVVHPPFKVVDGLACSNISLPEENGQTRSVSNTLRAKMTRTLSGMLLAELMTGAASGADPLDTVAANLGTAADQGNNSAALGAIWALETHLGDVLHESRGVIILPLGLIGAATNNGWVIASGSTLQTVTGHKVIVDSGFMGDPDAPKDPTPSTVKAFAMGDIFYDNTALRLLDGAIDLGTNTLNRLGETYAQLAYNPCTVGSVEITGLSLPS